MQLHQVDLRHQDAESREDERGRARKKSKHDKSISDPDIVKVGIDLREFYKSVEWDILGVPAARYFISAIINQINSNAGMSNFTLAVMGLILISLSISPCKEKPCFTQLIS